jgi:RNA polymerase sigma-70 factor (ECF subfamily)
MTGEPPRGGRPVRELPAAHEGVSDVLTPLVVRAREGDRTAFEEIFHLRFETLRRYVGSIIRDPDGTQDAMADTFVDAWRDLPKLRDAERFDGWLLRIAHRRAIDELRKQRPSTTLDAAGELADERRDASPELMAEVTADAELVRDALGELPAAQREVVTLRYLHDLSYERIARQMGRSNDAVRQLHQRAIGRLRRHLDKAG